MIDLEPKLENIRLLAKVYGWNEVNFDDNQNRVDFFRRGKRINVWYKKMTVGTALEHPYKGKTQMFRRNVSMKLLEYIFCNPRIHSGKGYYQKTEYNREKWTK